MTELTPEPRLRGLVLVSGWLACALGSAVIFLLPVPWLVRIAAAGGWVIVNGRELAAVYDGYRRYRRVRFYSSGDIELQTDAGDWQAAQLVNGSIVLGGIAWLRMQTCDGRRFAELLRGKSRKNEDWRRFQVIWRHLGSAR